MRSARFHILTIEDPIEFIHGHKKATIHQRELHSDTPTFGLALRAALRQAPKVILVGEMRDRETIEIALEASETGHLVMSTAAHDRRRPRLSNVSWACFRRAISPASACASRRRFSTSCRSDWFRARTALAAWRCSKS
jgi:hypothetical protein